MKRNWERKWKLVGTWTTSYTTNGVYSVLSVPFGPRNGKCYEVCVGEPVDIGNYGSAENALRLDDGIRLFRRQKEAQTWCDSQTLADSARQGLEERLRRSPFAVGFASEIPGEINSLTLPRLVAANHIFAQFPENAPPGIVADALRDAGLKVVADRWEAIAKVREEHLTRTRLNHEEWLANRKQQAPK